MSDKPIRKTAHLSKVSVGKPTVNHEHFTLTDGSPEHIADSGDELSFSQQIVKSNKEIREELRRIVTRNGKSGRIPEILEAELDDLLAWHTKQTAEEVRKAINRLADSEQQNLYMISKLGLLPHQSNKEKTDEQ